MVSKFVYAIQYVFIIKLLFDFALFQASLEIPSKNQLGSLPIHWACVNGHVAVVDIMLQVSLTINVP